MDRTGEPTSAQPILRCPVCHQALAAFTRVYACRNQHSFDVAKEGYLNLLLAHQKASSNPGDSLAMIRNRQKFLAGGYFAPLAERIAELVDAFRSSVQGTRDGRSGCGAASALNLLDAGCGDGYYLRELQARLAVQPSEPDLNLWGLDISKEAIRLAARQNQLASVQSAQDLATRDSNARENVATYLVASVHSLPFLDATLDYAFQVFAPTNAVEFARVLQPGGEVLIVRPGPDHLAGLKQILFEEQSRPHPDETEPLDGFEVLATERLGYDIQLADAATIDALLGMTPYYWTSGRSGRERLIGVERLATRVEFSLTRYRLAPT